MADLTVIILVALTVALAAVIADRKFRRGRRGIAVSKPSRDPVPVEQAFVQQFTSEPVLDRLTRQRDEYFGLIERIEKERNQWVDMWRVQAAEHQTAQAILGQQLGQTRQVAARAIHMLNAERKQHGLAPIDSPKGLVPYDGEPVFEPEKYALRMLNLRNQMAAPFDALALRDVIHDAVDVEFSCGSDHQAGQDENP